MVTVAQPEEYRVVIPGVGGSNPLGHSAADYPVVISEGSFPRSPLRPINTSYPPCDDISKKFMSYELTPTYD